MIIRLVVLSPPSPRPLLVLPKRPCLSVGSAIILPSPAHFSRSHRFLLPSPAAKPGPPRDGVSAMVREEEAKPVASGLGGKPWL